MTIIIETPKKKINITCEELLYISTVSGNSHRLCFVTYENEYYCTGSLKKYETIYPSIFRCHRSILVNVKEISEIDNEKHKIYFRNKCTKSCLFSRRSLKGLTQKWKEYIIS